MNSIIWKGVSSTTIQGLLICELPPITKPEIRISETVIDGRDGSIIEELGYSSYVKTVTIGLHGNFDINKVIKYFTGEGDIVFSNEPDKVYKAKICGKIDFTRLLRYRQASIPFLVQPFKYKLNEYLREAPTATVSGTSIAVNDSADANIKAFKIYGKSTQNGTPTPDASIDIVSLGDDGDIGVNVSGKNLLRITKSGIGEPFISNGITFTLNSDGGITMNGTASAVVFYNMDFENDENKYPTQTKLVASAIGLLDGITMVVGYFDDNNIIVDNFASIRFSIPSAEYELPKDAKRGRTYIRVEQGTTLNNVVVYPMIRAKTTTDTFEPYKTGQYLSIGTPYSLKAIPVTDKNLATYTDASGQMWCADEIDFKRGVYIRRVGMSTFTGSEEWTTAQTDNEGEYRHFCALNEKAMSFSRGVVPPMMCNQTRIIGVTQTFTSINGVTTSAEGELLYFYDDAYSSNDTELLKQHLANNKLDVLYLLAEPIEIPLTDEQIATFNSLTSTQPVMTITNDENAYMMVEYFKPFEVFNEGLEESKPLSIIKGSGTVEISVNGVGIFSYTFPEGENEVYIDSEKEDAYLGSVLKNRNMNGEFPILIPKTNKIEWSGDIESISILPRSRWL